MKRILAIIVLLALCISLYGCGKSEAATAFEGLVKGIGEVTLDSEAAIVAAENAHAALSNEDKEAVSESYTQLVMLRSQYDKKAEEHRIAEEAKRKAEEDQRLAAELTAAIEQFGTITLDSKPAMDAALTLYNSMSDEAKALVTNMDGFISALTEYLTLRQNELDKTINQLSKKYKTEYDGFQEITWYQHKSMPNYINIRSYIAPMLGIQGNNVFLYVRYNYTGDSWVFWENITILADGNKYSKSVNYRDVTRDNDTDVWEYYDEVFDMNLPMDSEKLQMMRNIAESKEAIIRFQGDNYYYDYTVKDVDKQIIKDALALYEAILEKNSLFSGMPGYVNP